MWAGPEALPVLAGQLTERAPSRTVVLADARTARLCLPELRAHVPALAGAPVIEVPAGERAKAMDTCVLIWTRLAELGTDRGGLLLCVGGGVVTDVGGFAAATYKRGIRCAHVPTTLMGMVDAAIGGKTAIDLHGVKNLVGLFHDPIGVYVHTPFLRTLPARERMSGTAEMLKHGLVADAAHWQDVIAAAPHDVDALAPLVPRSAAIKAALVKADPREQGVRKLLNFGHSTGHAIEAHAWDPGQQPLLHGEAIAIGMVCEAWVAWRMDLLPRTDLDRITEAIASLFTLRPLVPMNDERIIELMGHDKKNAAGGLRFALPTAIGRARPVVPVHPDLVRAALAHARAVAVENPPITAARP